MNADVVTSGPSESPRRSRLPRWGVAAVAAGALVLGAVGVAAAADSTPAPAPSGSAAGPLAGEPGPMGGPGPRHMKGMGPGGGMHMKGAIRGEWVVPDGDGGYRTMASQRGEVTAVDADSITVKSEDGTSRTYVVDDETAVNSGRAGISDVEVGAQAHVMAVKSGSTYTAVHVVDVDQMREMHERFGPPRLRDRDRMAPDAGASTAPSGSLQLETEGSATA